VYPLLVPKPVGRLFEARRSSVIPKYREREDVVLANTLYLDQGGRSHDGRRGLGGAVAALMGRDAVVIRTRCPFVASAVFGDAALRAPRRRHIHRCDAHLVTGIRSSMAYGVDRTQSAFYDLCKAGRDHR